MDKPFVDMHVHSFYSDGSMSPEEIVEAACKNGVGILAVADHDVIEGSLKIKELCEKNKIKYIPAVEIDSIDDGTNFHILAYGFDVENQKFLDFLGHTRFLLDENSVRLIEAMQKDYNNISLADYMDFSCEMRFGGWKTLYYFHAKGLTSSLKEGVKFYPQHNITYDKAGYSSISAVAYRIKKAGGYSILAHPGDKLIDTTDIEYFKRELERIVSYGLDGIECYYPSHSEIVTQACLDVCGDNNLLITAGSDCHGVFGGTKIGEMNISLDKVALKNLICE
ncbi:MAG: PHP domain-containing protein [Oscillospiraceae bacterium]|nr:PHP domain-containing protein [Oscillospiraceae bacterium]